MTDNQKIEKVLWFRLRWGLELHLPLALYCYIVWRDFLYFEPEASGFFLALWILVSAFGIYTIGRALWLLRAFQNQALSEKQRQSLIEWHTVLHEKPSDPILYWLYSTFGKAFQQSFLVVRFLWKNPFCFFAFAFFFILGLLGFLVPIFFPPLADYEGWWWLLNLWFGSFLMFSIFMVGYLLIGEFLQRRLLGAKRPWILELIVGYIWSIPLIIILSFFWLLFAFSLLMKSKQKEDGSSVFSDIFNIKDFFLRLSFYIWFTAFKYYTYANLAIIALEDRTLVYSFRRSSEFLRNHTLPLASIWFHNLLLSVAPVAFWFLFVGPLRAFFHLESWLSYDTFVSIGVALMFLMYVYLPFGFLVEQICFLLYYLKATHPEADFRQVRLSSEEIEKTFRVGYL